MKKLIPFLLFPFAVQAAEIGMGTFELCAATSTYFQAGACPCDLSITAGPNVDDTTADSDVVLVGDNCSGTLHVCMDVTADTPSRADCIANTGVTDKQTSTPSGAGTETFTGASTFTGSAETQYRIWAHLVPTNYPNRPTFEAAATSTFTTNAAPGGGGADITGGGLFVAKADAGNSDETTGSTDGLSSPAGCTQHFNSPCAELSELSPAQGQDIFLAEGAVWADTTWTISQGGTSGDVLVVSCYFNNASVPNQCSSF
jgi:hypothetical protein